MQGPREKEMCRKVKQRLTLAPTREVPFTAGRGIPWEGAGAGAGIIDLDSPALSASVLRLGSGSLPVQKH